MGNGLGSAFLRVYTFSPECTLISVGRMAHGGEWSKTTILPCLRRIVQISHCSTLRVDILSDLTDVSERLAQMIQCIS